MFEKGAAEPLHDRADDLAVQRLGIDDSTDILDRYVIKNLDLASRGIDREMRGVAPIAVGVLLIVIGALDMEAGEFRECEPRRSMHGIAVRDLYGSGLAAEPFGTALSDFIEQRLRGHQYRRTTH